MSTFIELETLIYLEKLKSYSLTAERLFTTQPGISKRIRKLEDTFGKRLVVRKGKIVTLTPAGRKLLVYAEKIMALRDEMTHEMTDNKDLTGTFNIGSSETYTFLKLPEVLQIFQNQYPKIRLDLQVETSVRLSQMLSNGQLDIAFLINGANVPGFTNALLNSYKMGWFIYCKETVPSSITEAVKTQPIITFSRDTMPYHDLVDTLKKNHISNYRIHCCASISALLNLTINLKGIGVFPKALTRLPQNQKRFKEIQGFDLPDINYYISYSYDANPMVKKLAAFAEKG